MLGFVGNSAAQFRAFHAAALAYGGADEGALGTRDAYGPAFYVAYVRDPDGHKFACIFQHYDPTGDAE
jgi:catechol 2,3-dioxygenase-like lactoylglutathione lyase family enzyme